MYFPKPSLNENDLAIIERGDTAAHSIEAGKYVSWHGRTGKAKAAILQGADLDDTLFDYDEDGALNASVSGLGTGINLWSYTDNNFYYPSTDGYVYATTNYNSMKRVTVLINGMQLCSVRTYVEGYSANIGVYVKKGLPISHRSDDDSGNGAAFLFYPITY